MKIPFQIYKGKAVYLLGNGTTKCREILQGIDLNYCPDVVPSAKPMAMMSYNAFKNSLFENTAYFEPFYLKDFIVTKSNKKS